ncbi:MAG: hypothetical protein C4527_10945 [Candidatus Omnitrophota bacterium]|nr:MAG: hypothetical protein C4527_10945 [Candidatus Omnitrophota bacterium]
MKKCFGMAILGLLCVSASPVFAQTILHCDFSRAQGYVDGPIVDQPAGAGEKWMDGAANVPSAAYLVIENEQLMGYQLDGSDTWIWIRFPVQKSGELTLTWVWQYIGPADGNVDIGMNISDSENFNFDGNPNLGWNEQGAMCRMQEASPIIDVRNGDWAGGGTYAAATEMRYTDGALIHMRMVVHVLDLTLDVYARKEGGTEVTLAQGYGFRRIPTTQTDGVNCLAIWLDGNTNGTSVMIDDILLVGPNGPTDIQDWAIY